MSDIQDNSVQAIPESERGGTPASSDTNTQTQAVRKDWSDRLGPITAFIASVVIGGAGVISTNLYNNAQLELKQNEINGQLELKKEEDIQQNKLELTNALDKFSHYAFSSDPKQREFGYALFSALGYPDLALKIGEYSQDSAVAPLAASQLRSGNASIKSQAALTLNSLCKVPGQVCGPNFVCDSNLFCTVPTPSKP